MKYCFTHEVKGLPLKLWVKPKAPSVLEGAYLCRRIGVWHRRGATQSRKRYNPLRVFFWGPIFASYSYTYLKKADCATRMSFSIRLLSATLALISFCASMRAALSCSISPSDFLHRTSSRFRVACFTSN